MIIILFLLNNFDALHVSVRSQSCKRPGSSQAGDDINNCDDVSSSVAYAVVVSVVVSVVEVSAAALLWWMSLVPLLWWWMSLVPLLWWMSLVPLP